MKHTTLIAILLLPPVSQARDILLELHGNDISRHTLNVYICNSEDDFLSDKKQFCSIMINPTSDITTVNIKNLSSGKYAISAFVDSNQNGKLNRNLLGKPTELYGFSRDARRFIWPQTFAESKIELDDGTTTQTIHLK